MHIRHVHKYSCTYNYYVKIFIFIQLIITTSILHFTSPPSHRLLIRVPCGSHTSRVSKLIMRQRRGQRAVTCKLSLINVSLVSNRGGGRQSNQVGLIDLQENISIKSNVVAALKSAAPPLPPPCMFVRKSRPDHPNAAVI